MEKFEVPQIQVELLHSLPKEVQEYILTLQKLLETLATQNLELSIQIAQNSQNSSKPPSSDPPFKRPAKKPIDKDKSNRPKGGQVGHSRHLRELVPLEAVDEVVEIYPHECDHCHAPLAAKDPTGEPLRHQVWELPAVKAKVKEYQFFTTQCSQCAGFTQSHKKWPQEVPTGQFGPRLVATLGVLHGQYQLSLRQTQELANDLWQLPLSLGGVADSCQKASVALAPTYATLESAVQKQSTNHVDETGWKREGKLCWLWVATNPVASLFKIRSDRGWAEPQRTARRKLRWLYQGFRPLYQVDTHLKLE